MSLKIPLTPPGIDPGIVRLVAQPLNHYAIPGPIYIFIYLGGPSSIVDIATVYGLDCPGIESRWGEIFRTCPDRP